MNELSPGDQVILLIKDSYGKHATVEQVLPEGVFVRGECSTEDDDCDPCFFVGRDFYRPVTH